MRQRFLIMFSVCIICIETLTACQMSGDVSEQPSSPPSTGQIGDSSIPPSSNIVEEVGLIFYSGEILPVDATLEEIYAEETAYVPAHWILKSGELIIDEIPAFQTKGAYSYNNYINTWDGARNFIISMADNVVQKGPKNTLFSFDYQTKNHLDYGNGYLLEITPDYRCILTEEGGRTLTFDSIDRQFSIAGKTVALEDLWYGGSDFDGNRLTIMYYKFGVLNPSDCHERYLVWVTLDANSLEARWSNIVSIPREYAPGSLDPTRTDATFASGKYYFSGGDTAAYLDLEAEKIISLEKITEQLDTLLPGVHRAVDPWNYMIAPTYLAGNTNDIAIFVTGYDSASSEEYYSVYYALCEDQLLGVLVFHRSADGSEVAAYDASLNLLQTTEINLQLKAIPLKFQCTNYSSL